MIEYTVNVSDYEKTEWRLNGKRHREDGPAIIWSDGRKYYYLDGQLHRTDGPAVIFANGHKEYYINGKQLTQETFLNKTKKHTIIVDGKEIKISHTSYKELKASLQ